MTKPKKEITIDFDTYVTEKKELKDFLKNYFHPEWEHLMKELGRETEWNEFLELRKKALEEKDQKETM